MRSLYVHFPFCETKCTYCDFYSLGREKTKLTDAAFFKEALAKEASLLTHRLDLQLDTLFFGGGTPSMTPPEEMAEALETLNIRDKMHAGTEWSLEANPSSIDRARFAAYRALGVNRISIGMQAVQAPHLRSLSRVHDPKDIEAALNAVFAAGFENVSVDLICGIPGQSLRELEAGFDFALRFPITHISCYLLTLAKGHPLFAQLPNENDSVEILSFVDQALTARGFDHYEVSNFCRDDLISRHNMRYWMREDYLGLGPSAHSFDSKNEKRWKNKSSLERYGEALRAGNLPTESEEWLTPDQIELEKWMLAFRLKRGFSQNLIASEKQKNRVAALVEKGYILPQTNGNYGVTPQGLFVHESLAAFIA